MTPHEPTTASLKTYKFLLDSQSDLTNLSTGVSSLNVTRFKPLRDLVTQIQPVLVALEDTIDQFGADFSVQNVVNQASECVFTLSTTNLVLIILQQHPEDSISRRRWQRQRPKAERSEQGQPTNS